MEELRNENELTMVEEPVVDFDDEYIEESNGVFKKVVMIGGGALVAGATALAIKNRDKIKAKLEERKIAKLEKKGYVVWRPEEGEGVEYSADMPEELRRALPDIEELKRVLNQETEKEKIVRT